MQQKRLYQLEALTRVALAAQSVLIADHHQPVTGAPQFVQRGDYAGQQA